MTYKDHITAIARAYVELDASRSKTRAEYEQARETRLIPALKAFYAFYQRDIDQEKDRLRMEADAQAIHADLAPVSYETWPQGSGPLGY